ncbi:hypothetical protein EAF00_003076 [Botryotinia globosa]|nr:hypothetical protein EAF00_003076 [Botryotinia globosa]
MPNRYAVKDFLLILQHHEDPIRPLDAPSQPAYFCVDEQIAFNCFPLLRMLFGNSTRPVNSHLVLHKDLFSPPADDDHLVFDPATTMVVELLWENKINFASIKNETPETVTEFMKIWIIWHQERKMSFSGPGYLEMIETFIDRVLAMAKYFGAVVNEIEDPKTMRILCWWSCHQRPFSSSVSLKSSLQHAAIIASHWSAEVTVNSTQADLNRIKNSEIRFIDTMPEGCRKPNFYTFGKANIFRKLPLLLTVYRHKLGGSLGDLSDELMYDPDVSAQKNNEHHSIGIYFQALMRSSFMEEQPGHANVTANPARLRHAFFNLGLRGTKIDPPDTRKRKYSSLEKPDTRPKLPVKNSKGTAKDLKKLASKESKVPPARTRLTRSRKSAPLLSGISRPRLQSPPKISSKNGLVNSSMVKNVTKDHDLRDDWLLDSQSNTVESQIPKKQQVRSYTYRKEKTVVSPKTLKLVIVSSEKADASRYEVSDPELALSESTLLRAIVYDKPHPIEQPGRLKMVIRNNHSITIKWNEVISDYARRGKPPAIAIQSWGLDLAFKAVGPWFERVAKNSGEWETWSADELVKGSKVDCFIGARDLHTTM